MDKNNRKDKGAETEEGTEWVGSIRIQKARVNTDQGKDQHHDTSDNAKGTAPQGTYWRRVWRFLDKPAIVIVTLAYTIFAGLQWGTMQESNRTNHEALISVQRAFVGLKTIESFIVRDQQGIIAGWQFFPQWENSGTTPTKVLRHHSSVQWRKDSLPSDFDFPDIGPNDKRMTLIASKTVMLTGPLPVHPEILADVKNDKQHLYFWGWAAYRDIFQNSPVHLTEFCRELTVPGGNIVTGEGIRFLWIYCGTHDCADENCEDYAEAEKRLAGQ